MSTSIYPRELLRDIAWSFCEPLPENPDAMIADVCAYAEAVGATVQAEMLTRPLRLFQLDVSFDHWIHAKGVDWERIPLTLRIAAAAELTGAELLWKVHATCGPLLEDSDAHYFEGLELAPDVAADGTPRYVLALGS